MLRRNNKQHPSHERERSRETAFSLRGSCALCGLAGSRDICSCSRLQLVLIGRLKEASFLNWSLETNESQSRRIRKFHSSTPRLAANLVEEGLRFVVASALRGWKRGSWLLVFKVGSTGFGGLKRRGCDGCSSGPADCCTLGSSRVAH